MMRKIYLFTVLSLLITGFANVKTKAAVSECDSVNNALTSKFRFLGGWNANGAPEYLTPEPGDVSQALTNFVKTTLPESVNLPNSDDEYFGDDIQFNTELNEASEVYLTMVHEGAGWKNTLGYYTYNIDSPPSTVYDIDSLVVIFPNVSQPDVIIPGNKVLLGEFPAGTGIGYFLIAQGWVGDTICIQSHIVFSDPKLNTFTTKKYRQQTILLNYVQEEKLLLCFEDIKRPGGDNDFNDAVFYITAEPGAIDTTDIPKIPTAKISGDTTMCDENAPAILKVELSGQAPWTIIYTDGSEEKTISNIMVNDFTFETPLKGTITLKSVKDKNKFGIVDGQASISVLLPTAEISDYQHVCGETEAKVSISLTGEAPWVVYYSIDDEKSSIVSNEDILNLNLDRSGQFELISVEDLNCSNTAEGILSIEINESPTAVISGDATICTEEEVTIQIDLTGAAPYSFVYTDGETETTITTEENTYQFTTTTPGIYTLISVDDTNCSGEVSGSASISDGSEGIQVEIEAPETSCFGEDIELTLIGETDEITVNWTTLGKGTFSSTDQLNTTYSPAEGETGQIEFFAEINNACATKTISEKIVIQEKLNASFEYTPSNNLLTNTQITFVPTENDYEEYYWDFGDENTSTATIASTEYSKGGIYTVTLSVMNAGCEGEGSGELEILSKDELYVPNAFNPGAVNSENQVVKVYGNNVDENGFAFRIVNRWGKTMYETNSFSKANTVGWNGVNNKTDVQQELNVFTYILRGQFKDGQKFERTGTITQVK